MSHDVLAVAKIVGVADIHVQSIDGFRKKDDIKGLGSTGRAWASFFIALGPYETSEAEAGVFRAVSAR